MTRRHSSVPVNLPGTIPAVAPKSKGNHGGRDGRQPIPPIELSDAATEALMPLPTQGWLRRTCQNTWWLLPLLFPFATTSAFIVRKPWAWALLATVAAAWVFAQSVAREDKRVTDREAFMWAAAAVLGMGALVTAVIGGIVLLGGWLG